LGRFDQTPYYLCFDCGTLTNASNRIAIEGQPLIDGYQHGLSYIYWQLPTTLGMLAPGTYDASQSLFYWTSINPNPAYTFHVPFTSAVSGRTIVSTPTPALIVMLPRKVDLSPVLRRVNPALQRVSAIGATALLRMLGRPATLRSAYEGQWNEYAPSIDLPTVSVQVGRYCSGLSFLVTLGIGAVVLAGEMRRRRLLIVGLAVGLALVANIVRIALVSLGAERWGEWIAHGAPHLSIAWALWGVALLLLMANATWLAHQNPARDSQAASA
jgi:exosortase/archaeosortase family protein